jgi:RNA polymerase sigma-70 factor (ECF subfamily)
VPVRWAIRSGTKTVLLKGRDNCLSGAELKGAANDASLVGAIRSGDESAMASLYDRYSSIVYAVGLRVLGDTGAAEDVLQDVFMQLWRNPGIFDAGRGSLGAWLAVIARNRAIDALRKRRPETDIADVVVSVEPDMAGDAERSRAMEKVRGTLGSMPAAQRSALEMAYFEGLTHTEIATKTGEPLGTIKTRIRSGLLALRKAFEV